MSEKQVRSGRDEFAEELQVRVVEARTALDAADAMGEPLLAQIAESDLADLRALAARNDVDVAEQADTVPQG